MNANDAVNDLMMDFVRHEDPPIPDENCENNKVDEQQHRCPDTAVSHTPVHIEWQQQNEDSDRDVVAPGSSSDQADCTYDLHDPKTDQDEGKRPVVMLYERGDSFAQQPCNLIVRIHTEFTPSAREDEPTQPPGGNRKKCETAYQLADTSNELESDDNDAQAAVSL
jgi:hypothetical protein